MSPLRPLQRHEPSLPCFACDEEKLLSQHLFERELDSTFPSMACFGGLVTSGAEGTHLIGWFK